MTAIKIEIYLPKSIARKWVSHSHLQNAVGLSVSNFVYIISKYKKYIYIHIPKKYKKIKKNPKNYGYENPVFRYTKTCNDRPTAFWGWQSLG